MTEKSEDNVDTGDSFEALLRRAARVSQMSARTVFAAGTKLSGGRFEIVRRVGEGGMGVVYEAFDSGRRAKVALKTLSRLEAGNVYRLKNEFRALADVSHPNLVRLHELFADDGQWFFTMDLIDGVRFDTWVRPEGVLDEARLRAALPELASAVGAIHDAGKLHRDLKPSNVLVTHEGRVVVLDFGLAVDPELGGVGQTVADDNVSGTPAYMAPEQAAGKAATAASDFYAIGVMLFEALTGKLPFEGRAGEMLAQKQTRAAPAVAESNTSAPADLAELCTELLAIEPAARPSSQAVIERLGSVSEQVAASSFRSSRAPQPTLELVGREAELAGLRDAFRSMGEGIRPVIVLMSGESGIGKSALLETFLGELRHEGRAVVLTGRCYERESVPFKGFDALVDELSRYLRKLGEDARDVLPREAYALRRLFPVLGRIDAIARAPEREVPDAFELRSRGFLALGELFGRLRDRQPLVLAIDDWQWSDPDSTTLLLHLVRQADSPKVLLIISHRSDDTAESPVLAPVYETLQVDSRLDVRRMTVGPLVTDAATRLVPGDRRDRQVLLREAAGNPFLLHELSRADAEASGHSLAEILRARVAALPSAERGLLEVLAVAARPLDLDLAATVTSELASARATFDALRTAHLARSGIHPSTVECYHDKVRESVAAGLAAERLRSIHGAIANAMAHVPGANPEHLALHFEHAGSDQIAAEYAVRAAELAARANAFGEAARLYEKALALGTFGNESRNALQIGLGNALANAGHGQLAAQVYAQTAESLSGPEQLELKSKAAEQHLGSGRLEHGLHAAAQVLDAYGFQMPRSPAAAMVKLLFERARLRLRGLELHRNVASHERSQELAALLRLAAAVVRSDTLRGAALNLQVLRMALDRGDVSAIVEAFQNEMTSRIVGIGAADVVPRLAHRAQMLLEKHPDPRLEATQQFAAARYEYMACTDPDLEGALAGLTRVIEMASAEPGLMTSHNRAIALFDRAFVLALLGRFADLARELPSIIDDAWQRSDLSLVPGLMGPPILGWIALGERAAAEREHARATRAWSALANPLSVQDFTLYLGEQYLLQDRGDLREAWAQCVAFGERFHASFSSRSVLLASFVQFHRGRSAAALAAATSDRAEREALLTEAERAPPLPVRQRGRRWLLLPHASAACVRGDRDRAVRLLQQIDAEPVLPTCGPIWTYATRRRLGVLVGGDEGKALVTEADAFFRKGGAIDPEHFVATLLPGCEIR